jgi:hypothetical protein
VARHRVVIPSAGIPAVAFVITAIMPVRSPQERKPPISKSNLPIRAVKARSNRGRLIPFIANNSQLQESSGELPWNGIVK